MTTPKRVQQRRTKGWRKPDGAIAVGRPTRWGNPWRPEQNTNPDFADEGPWYLDTGVAVDFYATEAEAVQAAVDTYWAHILIPVGLVPTSEEIRRELAGRDLMCWCPLDQPCHADVLLEIANA